MTVINNSCHRCCKCGKTRRRWFLVQNNYVVDLKKQYNSSWKTKPQNNSFICIENCI